MRPTLQAAVTEPDGAGGGTGSSCGAAAPRLAGPFGQKAGS